MVQRVTEWAPPKTIPVNYKGCGALACSAPTPALHVATVQKFVETRCRLPSPHTMKPVLGHRVGGGYHVCPTRRHPHRCASHHVCVAAHASAADAVAAPPINHHNPLVTPMMSHSLTPQQRRAAAALVEDGTWEAAGEEVSLAEMMARTHGVLVQNPGVPARPARPAPPHGAAVHTVSVDVARRENPVAAMLRAVAEDLARWRAVEAGTR